MFQASRNRMGATVHEAVLMLLVKSAEAVTYAEPAREASSSVEGQHLADALGGFVADVAF